MALWYALYKLATGDPGHKGPEAKIEPLPIPHYQPNRQHQNISIIPDGKSSISSDTRDVYIVSRVLGGGAANGFVGQLEKYGGGILKGAWTLGLSVATDDAPDPTHHWGVLVGDYVHQLGISNGYNYYQNEKYSGNVGWTKYKMGVTRFNDVAVKNSGMNVMNEMPEEYNALDNNCQHFTARLLDKILRDGRKKLKIITHQTISAHNAEAYPVNLGNSIDGAEGSETGGKGKHDENYPRWLELVSVNDEDDDLAIVQDEDAHSKVLDTAVITMINNTPTVKQARTVN